MSLLDISLLVLITTVFVAGIALVAKVAIFDEKKENQYKK